MFEQDPPSLLDLLIFAPTTCTAGSSTSTRLAPQQQTLVPHPPLARFFVLRNKCSHEPPRSCSFWIAHTLLQGCVWSKDLRQAGPSNSDDWSRG